MGRLQKSHSAMCCAATSQSPHVDALIRYHPRKHGKSSVRAFEEAQKQEETRGELRSRISGQTIFFTHALLFFEMCLELCLKCDDETSSVAAIQYFLTGPHYSARGCDRVNRARPGALSWRCGVGARSRGQRAKLGHKARICAKIK